MTGEHKAGPWTPTADEKAIKAPCGCSARTTSARDTKPPYIGVTYCAMHYRAPDLLAALREITEAARDIDGCQHAGVSIAAAQWSRLYNAANDARAILTRATGGE